MARRPGAFLGAVYVSRRQALIGLGVALSGCGDRIVPAAPSGRDRSPTRPDERLGIARRDESFRGRGDVTEQRDERRADDERPADDELALFEARPALVALPYRPFGGLPTPVDVLGSAAERLGIRGLYVKRDDRTGGIYGGGKPRKLEFLLGEAASRGAHLVVTSGGAGSNHAVATALYAKELGMRAVVHLMHQAKTPAARVNLLAAATFGAEVRLVGSQRQADRLAMDLVRREQAYRIAAGGSSPRGDLGFVNAGFELARQVERGQLPEPDAIYIAMGTMGSAVGLAIGVRAAGLKSRVVAVRASNLNTSSERQLRAAYRATNLFLREHDPEFPVVDYEHSGLETDGKQLGGGYARETMRGREAMRVFREHTHVALERTYTAKAFAALMSRVRGHQQQTVLFWNTHNTKSIEVDPGKSSALPPGLRGYLR